jgi:hypothetical protein
MRLVALVVALGIVAGRAHADEEPVPADPTIVEPIVMVPARLVPYALEPPQRVSLLRTLLSREAEARRMRNAGIITTVVGSIATAVGTALVVTGFCIDECSGGPGVGGLIGGSVLLAVGQGAVIGGIPMWSVGQWRASRAEAMRMSLTAAGLTGSF